MSRGNGIVAIIDIPVQSTIILDGTVKSILVDDFIGFCDVPTDVFHLFVVQGAGKISGHNSNENSAQPSMQTSGLVIFKEGITAPEKWAVAHKYERATEEISLSPLDDLTTENLILSVNNGFFDPRRIVSYHNFMKREPGDSQSSWSHELIDFISLSILRRRGLQGNGDKIVPSAYDIEDDDQLNPNTQITEKENDGKIMAYPPIPCVNVHVDKIRFIQHEGTKKYLKRLSPSEKTSLFLNLERGDKILDDVLSEYYDNKWEDLIGDLQLSFVIFLTINCLASFQHWRDILSMISFTSSKSVNARVPLFRSLIKCLICQMRSFGDKFFEEVQYTDGNFLVPAIQRIYSMCLSYNDDSLNDLLNQLTLSFEATFLCQIVSNRNAMQRETGGLSIRQDETYDKISEGIMSHIDSDDDDDPLIVSIDDYEASMTRCNSIDPPTGFIDSNIQKSCNINRDKYPLLFSSNMIHEDIMMTCARILDEKNDVSLVREAAAYLQEIGEIK